MKEPQQLLKDATIIPTESIIAECLGATSEVFKTFLTELKTYDIALMDWRYYNDGKAWLSKGEYRWTTKRGTNKVVPLFWVSIWEGFFKISFNFSSHTKDTLLSLPLSEKTKAMIHNTQPNGNKVKFIPIIFDVDQIEQCKDIYVLAQFRKEHI